MNSLATTAAERKERLIALRKRKAGEVDANGETEEQRTFTFKQRNFDPETRQLRKRARAAPALASRPIRFDENGDEIVELEEEGGETVEKTIAGKAQEILERDEEARKEELDFTNIQPKRANWDLKRDLTRRTRQLARRTDECYAILFRQKHNTKPLGEKDLLGGMGMAAKEIKDGRERDEGEMDDDEEME